MREAVDVARGRRGAAALTATVPVLFGRPVLENAMGHLEVPFLGEAGPPPRRVLRPRAYLCVVGLVFMVFEAFGDDSRAMPDDAPAPADP